MRHFMPSSSGLRLRLIATLGVGLALAACQAPPPKQEARADAPLLPEIGSGLQAKAGWHAQRFMVAAANPLAAQAGFEILKAGGSAVDAAIAVQMVLTLVEPQSSGIGGGAFMLHFDGRAVAAYDGRETAPASATEALFLQADGKPMPFLAAAVGGRAVGVPGVVPMLALAHQQHGRLPWARLMQPAIALADKGFALSPRLHTQLTAEQALRQDPLAAAYFYRAGADGSLTPKSVGETLRNPALARVLRELAARGPHALADGAIAEDIVRRVRGHVRNPGGLTQPELAAYRPVQREAICTVWRERYRICGMPPPSSGHLAIMQILMTLDAMPDAASQTASPVTQGAPDAAWLHRYTEAARLAFADRAQYVADPAFVAAPGGDWRNLLDAAYLRERAALIGDRSMGQAQPGRPPGATLALGSQRPQVEGGTSHISIVDAQGRAVAMTTSVEAVFGARLMSDGGTGLPGGFLLNNQLTDFSFSPTDAQGRPVANRVAPGKRPRSSMSPTLVFDARSGALLMSVGSPGGAGIIHFTAKTLLGTLAWGLDAQRAIDLPNFGSFNGPTLVEAGRFPDATVKTLRDRGHTVNVVEMTSGLQAIQREPRGWHGGADPRREGAVLGE
jgi:gamma-glutamyltranspeptidase / glutathione hydrolase